MSNKGLYKIAVERSGPTPPQGTVPANDRLLKNRAEVITSTSNGFRSPTMFRMYDSQGAAIDVDTMTDTPYYINSAGWQPPTDRPFSYSEVYNAQVADPQGWNKYQEYRRKLPLEDINKVTRLPAHDALIRRTTRYSSADDFVNTVGQGPLFRWYSVPTFADATSARRQGPQRDHTPIYALSGGSVPGQGLYLTARSATPYGSIMLSKDNTKGLAKPPAGTLDNPQATTALSGGNNGLVSASSYYLPLPQTQLAAHEMAHALTWASRAPGTTIRRPRSTMSASAQPSEASGYGYDLAEQVQAAHTLNKSYQALLNSLAKGNHKDMPSEFRQIIDTYPAYGSKEQFMARNDALLAHPELAVKYLGVEPSRALAQYKQLKYNAWLQRNGWYTTPRPKFQRLFNIGYPDVGDAQKHLDFFNDNYFADASFNSNAAQRHA